MELDDRHTKDTKDLVAVLDLLKAKLQTIEEEIVLFKTYTH